MTIPATRHPNETVRILIADDHAAVRLGLRSELESNPKWEICGEAENGQEAIEKVLELKPDLVILDISRPIINVIEASRQIRRLAPNIRILLCTMHNSTHFNLI